MTRISRDRDDVHIALLRGVNVGGAKQVKMLELRELARRLGFGTPRTLLTSGNLVYAAHGTPAADAAVALEQGIQQSLKVSARVVVVTAVELDQIIDDNPFDDEDIDPSRLFVSVWRDPYDRAALLPLLEQTWGDERLHLGARGVSVRPRRRGAQRPRGGRGRPAGRSRDGPQLEHDRQAAVARRGCRGGGQRRRIGRDRACARRAPAGGQRAGRECVRGA
jgi:uncharacterized protein (DUF1697 family)